MTSHPLILSNVLSFIILYSSSQHSLSSYHKLKNISLSLCPKQENSSVPQCGVLNERLAGIRAALIQDSIGGADEPVEEVTEEQGSLRKPLLEQTLAVIRAFEDKQLDSNTCEPGDIASLLFSSLKEVSEQWSTQNYDKHYLTLFAFCASRAQTLYSNLQQIHHHANQVPLVERRQY